MQVVVPEDFKFLYQQNDERPVVKIPNEVLRKKCTPVTRVNNRVRLISDAMVKAMRTAHGIGLAAPQLGF
ncbi:MAG: peptide deformylase, partial [Fimbriimonadaceae bacterium]|nr:peptide deformylase [Fimbriimonadaceae bacterium]